MELSDKQITVIFKSLCDENRVKIFRLLQGGELCACHIIEQMELSQPTLSHHMKILCDSGLPRRAVRPVVPVMVFIWKILSDVL